jgi:hypothetical protein
MTETPSIPSKLTFLVIGKLRRDVMILGTHDNESDAAHDAEEAVKQGRAQESFVLVAGYAFSASDRPWVNPDNGGGFTVNFPGDQTPATDPSIPPVGLNPEGPEDEQPLAPAEAEAEGEAREPESIEGNRQANAEEVKVPDVKPAPTEGSDAKKAEDEAKAKEAQAGKTLTAQSQARPGMASSTPKPATK